MRPLFFVPPNVRKFGRLSLADLAGNPFVLRTGSVLAPVITARRIVPLAALRQPVSRFLLRTRGGRRRRTASLFGGIRNRDKQRAENRKRNHIYKTHNSLKHNKPSMGITKQPFNKKMRKHKMRGIGSYGESLYCLSPYPSPYSCTTTIDKIRNVFICYF